MLLRSVSGIRGVVGTDLTPAVAMRHAEAFGTILKGRKVVIATDTRPTGPMIKEAAIAGLLAVGCDVIDIGIAPTPTVPLAVSHLKAAGGIAVTASHNPVEWNALKFLGSATRMLTPQAIENIYRLADKEPASYKTWKQIGTRSQLDGMEKYHVRPILGLRAVDTAAIKRARLRVVFDAGGGAGMHYGPELLTRLGCRFHKLYCDHLPQFPRKTEPVPKNLRALGAEVRRRKADIGFAVDPDADRLAIVDETGKPLGEERTLILATYWVLSRTPGPVVINLSTSRAVLDVARSFGVKGYTAKVGEANVAAMMKTKRAVIGGEGNGGVIMPVLHCGRDSLLGMALVLSLLANAKTPVSQIAASLPYYHAIKTAARRPQDLSDRLKRFADHFIKEGRLDRRDGIKVDFDDGSVHVRPSNTEPIVRVSSEAVSRKRAQALIDDALRVLKLK